MEIQAISARTQLALFLLFELMVGFSLWFIMGDKSAPLLENIGNVGTLLSWVPVPLNLYFKFRSKGTGRWQWQFPDTVGLILAWVGYFMRQEAVSENSWTLANHGTALEIVGGLAVIYSLVVLVRLPKDQR